MEMDVGDDREGFEFQTQSKDWSGLKYIRVRVSRANFMSRSKLSLSGVVMATTSYNDIDFDADDFTLPPQVDTDFTVPSRLVSTTATNGPTSPIQIDEEVVVKNKRKPAVKLIDRFFPCNVF